MSAAQNKESGEYESGRLWFERRGKSVTIGLTVHAVDEIGIAESVELPESLAEFEKGDVLGVVIGAQGKIEIICPADGQVRELNETAVSEPESVSDDPQEEGWLLTLEMEDPSDLEEWLSSEEEEI